MEDVVDDDDGDDWLESCLQSETSKILSYGGNMVMIYLVFLVQTWFLLQRRFIILISLAWPVPLLLNGRILWSLTRHFPPETSPSLFLTVVGKLTGMDDFLGRRVRILCVFLSGTLCRRRHQPGQSFFYYRLVMSYECGGKTAETNDFMKKSVLSSLQHISL